MAFPMITTDGDDRETRIDAVNSLARTFRMFGMPARRTRALLAGLLFGVLGGARANAVISFPTIPIAEYREEHRTILLELDTTDATWHGTRRYFPSLQLCWEYAEDAGDRAPATVVYDCRWSD